MLETDLVKHRVDVRVFKKPLLIKLVKEISPLPYLPSHPPKQVELPWKFCIPETLALGNVSWGCTREHHTVGFFFFNFVVLRQK